MNGLCHSIKTTQQSKKLLIKSIEIKFIDLHIGTKWSI